MTPPLEPNAIKAVIFDCDGVLFDSCPANVAFYNAILEELGLPPLSEDKEQRVHMLSSPQVLQELFGNDPARHRAAARIASSMDYGPFFRLMEPAVGLHDVLERLRRVYAVGMATNRGRTIPELLEKFRLEDSFDAVVGVLDVSRPKPHPDMLIECLRRLDIRHDAAIYVGDTEGDREAAAAAGMSFIAVGKRSGHPLEVDTIADLPELLLEL